MVGDEPVVVVDWWGASDYAKRVTGVPAVAELFASSVAEFATRVHAVDGRWDQPPGAARAGPSAHLVRHIVEEEVWAPPLLAGSTVAEIGDRFAGDLLGDDPVAAFDAAADAALAAVREPGAMERTVHLSFGDHPASEYAMQLANDHLVHAWDLARALGVDDALDPDGGARHEGLVRAHPGSLPAVRA